MNDDGAPLGHVRVIERSGPGSDHRLRVMGSAAEHIGCRHDDEGIPARADEASVEVGQKRALTTSSFRRLVPVGETLYLDPAHTFHRAQVILYRSDEEQSRSGASLLGARRAFLDAATFEKSGVAVKPAFRGSTLIRFVSLFQSPRPRYSRSASLRAAASSIVLSQLSAWPGMPASAIHR